MIALSSSPTTRTSLRSNANRRQIFVDIANVLILGAARQDLAADHQERGRDNLFGSGRRGGWHDHLRVCPFFSALQNAPEAGAP